MTTLSTFRRSARALAALALAGALGAAACNDYLTGGELSNEPNNPTSATNRQLFVGIQSNIWSFLGGEMARIAGMFTQQFEGFQRQYYTLYTSYTVAEQTTNGFHVALYTGGGLTDIRQLQANARAQGDTVFLGIAQIQEAMLIGAGADIFGDLVYTHALTGEANPPLDKQLAIYDSLQVLLSRAITNLSGTHNPATNLGPGAADLNYGGNVGRWTRLAHTLKARLYLHTAEVRPAAYAQALAESQLGLTSPAEDYKAIYSGAPGEMNPMYLFMVEQRFGDLIPDPSFVSLLETRDDPRLDRYFDVTGDVCGEPFFCLSYNGDETGLLEETYDQPLVTASENLLIWAETAQRGGNNAAAVTQLNREKAIQDVPTVSTTLTGTPLLQEILTEKYIALFESLEPWNDYKRTCFPNLTPKTSGLKIAARLLYDAAERQTNTSIPGAEAQPTRNQNDPANATSIDGSACRGQ